MLVLFYKEVSNSLDKGKAVNIVYLNIAKAFNRVPHKCLIHKLKNIGIEVNICTWIKRPHLINYGK